MTENKNFNIKQSSFLWPINIDFEKIFQNKNPIDLEIGTGRTHFFFDRSNNFLDRNIVGIEWKYEFIKSAHNKIIKNNIKNALPLHGNAWILVPLLFKKESISQVFINFPDPWWKMRHKKRLLLNDVFLPILHSKLKSNGVIILQTDVKELFDFYISLLEKNKLFKHINQNLDLKAKTHREKKCLEQNLAIYRATFIKYL